MTTQEPITLDESRQLIDWERVIQAGRETFLDVGAALASIRDRRLYRSDYATFEAYCKGKWDFSRQHVNSLIAAVAAVKSLPPKMESMLSNSSQASALSKVEPAKRVEVLEAASAQAESENRPLRAKDIAEAAKEEKPVTLEAQWRDALPKSMLPERSKIQEFIHDEHVRREEAIASLDATELGQLKLEKEVSARMFKDAIKSKLSA